MRPRILLLGAAAVIVAAFVLLSLGDSLIVDLLWFTSLGYRGVFATTIAAEIAIFAIVWLIAFLAIWISALIALHYSRDRERLRVVRRSDEMVEVNLPELIRALGDRMPWRLIVAGAAALLALFVAQGEASSWDVYLRAFYGVPFGLKEPAFGRDIGFFVFSLPFFEEIRDLLLTIIVLTAASTAALYLARGALDFRESPPLITRPCAAHLSALLGIFFLQRALSYWISRYLLTLHGNGVVFGLRYVDQVLWRPGLWLLV